MTIEVVKPKPPGVQRLDIGLEEWQEQELKAENALLRAELERWIQAAVALREWKAGVMSTAIIGDAE